MYIFIVNYITNIYIYLVFNVHATIYVNTCLKYCFHFVIFAYYICIIKLPVCALYNLDSLETYFYIVKCRLTGVFISFLISAQNIDCGYSLEPPQCSCSKEHF